jgi:hypothetical protein
VSFLGRQAKRTAITQGLEHREHKARIWRSPLILAKPADPGEARINSCDSGIFLEIKASN